MSMAERQPFDRHHWNNKPAAPKKVKYYIVEIRLTGRTRLSAAAKRRQTAVEIVATMCHKPPIAASAKKVSVYRAPHLLCCRALEVQKVVCAPDALHLRQPVNAYNEVV